MLVVQSRCLLFLFHRNFARSIHTRWVLYICVGLYFLSGFGKFSECVCRSKASSEWPSENNLSTSTTSKSNNISKVSDDARA